jgi:hypothetical protein
VGRPGEVQPPQGEDEQQATRRQQVQRRGVTVPLQGTADRRRGGRDGLGVEEVPAMLSRLLEAHEVILTEAHDAAARSAELGDDGTNDLLVSQVIRTGELQAWFLAEHLVDTPLVRVRA